MLSYRMALMIIPLIAQLVFAVPPEVEWSRIYGGEAGDLASDVQLTSDGGYIIVGESASYNFENYDVYVVRTNAAGDTLWTRVFGGDNNDHGASIRPTADGGWIIGASTESYGAGADDLWLVKIDGSGNHQWDETYGSAQIDYCTAAEPTADGGYILCGYTLASEFAYPDALIIKTNSAGVEQWTRTFATENMEAFYDVHELAAGGYVICGYNEDLENGNGSWDAWVVKTDSAGLNPVWRYYGGWGWDMAHSIVSTTDGGFAFVGTTDRNFSITGDYYFVKLAANLDTMWTRSYGRVYIDEPHDLMQTSDGGYLMTGQTCIPFGGDCRYDMYLVRTDADGDTLWTWEFGDPQNDAAFAAKETNDGGYIVVGYNTSPDVLDYDLLAVKLAGSCADSTPRAPQGLTVYRSGNDMRLRWERVTSSVADCPITVSGYRIFTDTDLSGAFGTVIATPTDTTFLDPGAAGSARKFYQVTATTP